MRKYTQNEKAAATMLIKFFNMQCGAACRHNNEWNQKVVLEAMDRVDGDISVAKNHIREYAKTGGKDLCECFEGIMKVVVVEEPKVVEVTKPTQVTDQQVQYSMGILEQAVIQLIAKTQSERIESEIMGQVEDKVRQFISDEYGTIERKITTVVDGKKVPMKGIQHDKFETVLKFVANDEPVFLTGPAGSGMRSVTGGRMDLRKDCSKLWASLWFGNQMAMM